MNWKKILLLLGLLAITVGVGYFIYYLLFGAPAGPTVVLPPEANVNVPVQPLPPSAVGGPVVPTAPAPGAELPPGVSAVANGGPTLVTPVTNTPATGASVSANGSVSYYNRIDGKFYRRLPNGQIVPMSEKVFFDASGVTFDPAGGKAIIEYPDGSNILYDFNNSRQVTLPAHWEDFRFDPSGDQIAAKSIGTDPSNRYLIVSNPDGSGAKAIQALGENADKVQVNWSPNNQIIATATTGEFQGLDSREIFFVGQNHENFKSLVVEGFDFRPEWSPSGEQLLYSAASSTTDYKPELWLVDANGDNIGRNRRTLNVNTWADKCTFAGDSTVYCAVPSSMPRGAGLQPAVADDIPDNIYKIDLVTGLQTMVAEPEGGHTVGKLMLAPDGKTLYFTDKTSQILNEIKISE